jgi:hypothetical protein
MSFRLILGIAMAVFVASQIYWLARARALAMRLVKTRRARILAMAAGLTAYVALFLLNFEVFGRRASPTRLTWHDALITAPFEWWVVCSLVAFLPCWYGRCGAWRDPPPRYVRPAGGNSWSAAPAR